MHQKPHTLCWHSLTYPPPPPLSCSRLMSSNFPVLHSAHSNMKDKDLYFTAHTHTMTPTAIIACGIAKQLNNK